MERLPNQEKKIEKAEIVEMLKTKGLDDPEVKELVIKWTMEQETLATQVGTVEASITFNIDRSDLYLAVGDIDGALEALEDARLQAHSEGQMELYNQIMTKMDEIEKS